ncbi:MAG TPA: DUF1801 domain-containing protein [Thermoanaerobaculia bacterium]|jgi:hypothetical protein
MKNTDPRVDMYIAKAAPFARPILTRLRAAVHEACPEAEETIKWGMPFFLTDGKILCYMAAFKAHAAFGFWRRGETAVLGEVPGKANEAMGQLGRITSLNGLPPGPRLRRWIRTAAQLNASTTASRPKARKARPGTGKTRTARRKP